jgi:adenosine kinase
MSILVSGSIAYDNIMNFPDSFKNHILPEKIHILNVCFVIDKMEKSRGGTAGNIAYNLNLLKADPIVLGIVGKDGDEYLNFFTKVGMSTEYITKDENILTSSAYITTDEADNQITAFFPGPSAKTGDIAGELKNKVAIALISPTDKQVMIKHAKQCRELNIPFVFDPGQQMTAFSGSELQEMIAGAEFVIGNDYEMHLLREKTGWDNAKILINAKNLITTLGEKGSLITTSTGEEIMISPCAPLNTNDPTGAGDAYRAGFFAGFEKGFSLKVCGQMGSVSASYAIETYGTQDYTYTLAEFTARYEQAYNEKLILN